MMGRDQREEGAWDALGWRWGGGGRVEDRDTKRRDRDWREQRPRERQIREKGPEVKMRLGVGRSRHRGEETEA